MKTVLVVSHALEIGGAERALLGLLESFDKEQYQVDLFLMRHQGELMGLLPEGINLLPEKKAYTGLAIPFKNALKKGLYGVALGRVWAKVKAKHYVRRHNIQGENDVELEYSHKYTRFAMPQISDKDYDLAISFLTPHYFVAEKVNARKKAAWIHTDYSYMDVDKKSELAMWRRYDHIISISEDCTKGFLSKFPELKDKIILIENIISPAFIRKQAEMQDVRTEMAADGSVKLLSVGRFSVPKNFDNIPDICRRIVKAGLNIKWYIIGFGNEEKKIREKIHESGMEDDVIILGKKSNPYPYIKECDVYVQPSRYEGKCVAVREAQILGKPVIITDYPTAFSQLNSSVDGIIVPMDNAICAEKIAAVLNDKELLFKLSTNTKQMDYTNHTEIEKVYFLIPN